MNAATPYRLLSSSWTDASDADVAETFARARLSGFEGLTDEDVLAMLLGGRAAAREALAVAGSLRGLFRSTPGALSTPAAEGGAAIAEHDALVLHAAFDLSRRARTTPLARATPIAHSRDVVRAFGPRLVESGEEQVLVVAVDTRNRPVGETVVARGGADGAAVTPGQVLRFVIRAGGSSFLVLHNHPSGDPMPSDEDIAFTRSLREAGAAAEVLLLDHVIVASGGAFSFLDAGLITANPQGTTP